MKRIIEPTMDFCAKELFENEKIRRYFLSAFLAVPVEEIADTQTENPLLRRWRKSDKEGILDVVIKLQNGRRINIEVQVRKQNYWDKRSVYYLARLYTQGIGKADNYQDLQQCVNISILDFNFLKTSESHTVFRFRDSQGRDYTDAMEIHIVELRKLQEERHEFLSEECDGDDVEADSKTSYEAEVQEWIRFFKCKSEEDVIMLKNQTSNPGIKEAVVELLAINQRPGIRAKYEAHLKRVRDQNAREDYVAEQAENRGIEMGIERGREQGIEQSIQHIIQGCINDGETRDEIVIKICKWFHVEKEKAENYYKKYSKEDK